MKPILETIKQQLAQAENQLFLLETHLGDGKDAKTMAKLTEVNEVLAKVSTDLGVPLAKAAPGGGPCCKRCTKPDGDCDIPCYLENCGAEAAAE